MRGGQGIWSHTTRRFTGAMVALACARPTIDDAMMRTPADHWLFCGQPLWRKMASFLSRQPVSHAQPTGQHGVITAHPTWTEHSMMLEPAVFAAVINHPSPPLDDLNTPAAR
jgi:hypothetical protein